MKPCTACNRGSTVSRRKFKLVLDEMHRQRKARVELEEILAMERQIHAAFVESVTTVRH
jgi:hypothetical protein